MKDMASEALNGFFGSFVLGWAVVASVILGARRVFGRLYNEFEHNKPLHVGPGQTIRMPDSDE